MKIMRYLYVLVAALAVAASSVSVAMAENGNDEGPFVGCLNSHTVSEGDDMSPFLRWIDPSNAEEVILTVSVAETFRDRIAANGGSWTFRYFGDSEDPLTHENVITEGACKSASGEVHDPRKYLGCYSPQYQVDPEPIGTEAPYAVAEPLSRTDLANGWWLICKIPQGYRVLEGAIVSTGMNGYAMDSTGTIPGAERATPKEIADAQAGDPLGWAKVIVKA